MIFLMVQRNQSKNAYVLFYMRQDPPSVRTRNGTEQANSTTVPTSNPTRPQRRSATQRNSWTSESEESMSSNEESDDMDYDAWSRRKNIVKKLGWD